MLVRDFNNVISVTVRATVKNPPTHQHQNTCIIHNSPKLETAQILINSRINKYIVLDSSSGILHSNKNKATVTYNMYEFQNIILSK